MTQIITDVWDTLKPLSKEQLTEARDTSKTLYLKGVFAQAEKKNRNRRIYPYSIMNKAIHNFKEMYVNKHRAIGEVEHPKDLNVNLDRIAIKIDKLDMEGNDVIGKASIIETVPAGALIAGLIRGGVQLGVSTRGSGELEMQGDTGYIKEGFYLKAIDVVFDPSGIDCFVSGIEERVDYVESNFTDEQFTRITEQVNKKELKAVESALNSIVNGFNF